MWSIQLWNRKHHHCTVANIVKSHNSSTPVHLCEPFIQPWLSWRTGQCLLLQLCSYLRLKLNLTLHHFHNQVCTYMLNWKTWFIIYSVIGVRLYLAPENLALENYSFISANRFNDKYADGLWCQSASNFNESANAGGGWYIPNGERVGFTDSASDPLHQEILTNQFVLLRDHTINNPGYQGLYQCKIPYSDSNTSVLVIAIYGTTKYSNNGME